MGEDGSESPEISVAQDLVMLIQACFQVLTIEIE